MAIELNSNLYNKDVEQVPTRNGFGEALVELGETNPNVVALTGDLAESTRVLEFAKKYPDRFIEVGVAEQNMMGLAAGLALYGKIPFASSYATFSPGRNWDQLRVSVCYSEANVKVIGAHSGISVGPDGATHQALEDIAITRVLPNLTVIVPCDAIETKKEILAMAAMRGPAYIRFAREKTPVMTLPNTSFEIGKAYTMRDGVDVAVIGAGPILYGALIAAERLAKENINVRVINLHTIKPIDKEAIISAAKECGAVVTVEEHQINGGVGSAICEVLSESYPVPVVRVGVNDHFGESGTPTELFKKYGLDDEGIEAAIKKVIELKKGMVK
jgi:transketolase